MIRQVVIDWGPIIILFTFYTFVGPIVSRYREVNVEGIYNLEKILFGWMTEDGEVPALAANDNNFLALFSILVYSLHIFVPLFIIVYLGYLRPNREVFSKFRIALITVTTLGFATFILFPVAPPWYVELYGLVKPDNFQGRSETAAGLLMFDRIFNFKLFEFLYGTAPPAPFAAFPSLHSGYAFVSALVLTKSYGERNKWIYLIYLYPLAVWFSAVYLQHHYIVDLIGGALYAYIAYYLGIYVVLPIYHRYFGSREKTDR